jgi:NAD(P)H-nitrite reductase large subunit
MNTKYLIIGNSAAGIGAVEGIRRFDKEGRITVLTLEKTEAYARPFIVNYASGKADKSRIYFSHPDYLKDLKAEVLYGRQVTRVKASEKKVLLDSSEEITYEKLLIASGGKPIRPRIKGDDAPQVINFMTIEDAEKMKELAQDCQTAVVLGGGLIGLKATEALVDLYKEVVMVELADYILSRVMDEKAASMMQTQLEKKNVRVIVKNSVDEIISRRGNVTGVKLKDSQVVECQMAVIAIGVTPNTDFIDKNEIKVNRGIVVDDMLRTSADSVYAAGDAAEARDIVTGENSVIAIWPVAKRQGLIAGMNMAGEVEKYGGGLVENVLEFNGMPVISYGLINADPGKGFEVLMKEGPGIYKKVIVKKNIVAGVILVNDLNLPGIYRDLVLNRIDVSSVKNDLLKDDFGWKYFPKEMRDKKYQSIE